MEKVNTKENCLSCKIVTVSCLTAIGCFLIYTAQSYKGKSKGFTAILGTGSICLAVGEIFDKSPFRTSKLDQ